MARTLTTEEAAAIGAKRWENVDDDTRAEAMRKVREGRATVKDVLAEVRALRAELAELRAERQSVAA